jgi:hypothetical protein
MLQPTAQSRRRSFGLMRSARWKLICAALARCALAASQPSSVSLRTGESCSALPG